MLADLQPAAQLSLPVSGGLFMPDVTMPLNLSS